MNTPLKTGLASFGMSGQVFHAPFIDVHAGFELTAIFERSKELSKEKYPKAQIVRSIEALCHDDSLELLVINTPDHTHYEFCKLALENGKHVIVEKPFTQTYAQAMELAELAEKNNLVLSIFHNRRWDGDFLTVKQVLNQELLGRLVSYEAHFDRFRNFIQKGTWKEDPSTGTGTLYNLGSHMIDQALVLFGKPASITADIRILRDGGKVDDFFELWLEYPQVKVKLCGSYLVKEPGPRYILHGIEGSFLKWGLDPQEDALKQGKLPNSPDWGKESSQHYGLINTTYDGKDMYENIPTLAGNYIDFYENIFHAIRHGQSLEVTPQQGADVVRVIEAAMESARWKKAIAF
jgi:scyllo-inositol 2-dehydrogenase (NADP+)